MASAFPRFAVIQSVDHPEIWMETYLRYTSEEGKLHRVLQVTGEEIVSPHSKFELVRATGASDGFFNIRCCYNNKYWVAQSSSDDDSYIIVAGADEPNEDQSQLSCTLFELDLISVTKIAVRFRHPQLGRYLSLVASSAYNRALFAHSSSLDPDDRDVFRIINWDSLVILPKHVAFKGDNNGQYLKAYYDSYNRLQFAVSENGDPLVGDEVFMTKDGRVRIKNRCFGKFWRLDRIHSWIKADSDDTSTDNPGALFSPVKIGDNVIGLRSAGNNNFCMRFTSAGLSVVDCLAACTTTLSTEARLVVEELVILRHIYNVKFRLLDARIYNQNITSTVNQSAINNSQVSQTVPMNLVRTAPTSTWNCSISLKLGVKATIETGVPLVASEGGKVEVSNEFTGTFEWGETVTTDTEVVTEYVTIELPPMTKVTVSLLATQASCDVPFSYTQRDTLLNGDTVISNFHDGLYTGINSFNFHCETKEEKL